MNPFQTLKIGTLAIGLALTANAYTDRTTNLESVRLSSYLESMGFLKRRYVEGEHRHAMDRYSNEANWNFYKTLGFGFFTALAYGGIQFWERKEKQSWERERAEEPITETKGE